MSEHRVTMLGASWRRFEDPSRSRDPRVQAVLASLAALPGPQPRPEFRSELRAQLVAIAPRLIAEGVDVETPMIDIVPRPTPVPAPRPARRPSPTRPAARPAPQPTPARHSDSALDRLRRIHWGRPLAIAASVVVVFTLLLGGAVWMSRKSLPGDSLYGLKRASERLELATAGSDSERAQDYLDFAVTRVDEVRDLWSQSTTSAAGAGLHASGGLPDTGTLKLIYSTLSSADSDVRSAAKILGRQAVGSGSTAPLSTMISWAPKQLNRLDAIAAAMPPGTARDRALQSAQLVTRALQRAEALAPKLGCSCLGSAGSDDLGPLPCGTCTVPASTAPTTRHSSAPAGGGSHGTPGSSTGHATVGQSNSPPSGSSHAPPSKTASNPPPSSGTSPGPSTPPPLLPSLPISVKSCGIGATLGPIGLGIGLCPISVGLSLGP